MAKAAIKLTGGKAAAVFVLLLAVGVIRILSLDDMKGNRELMQMLEAQMTVETVPGQATAIRDALNSGDDGELEKTVQSITTSGLTIESVQASFPLFNFSTTKDVVVKATYAMQGANGITGKKTRYYHFRYGSLGNTWNYRHRSSAFSYYLNFL